MLKLFYGLYSFWIAITFFALTPFMLLAYTFIKLLVKERDQIKYIFYVNRVAFFIWSIFNGMRYKITGIEHIDKNQTYIVVPNHTNSGDMVAGGYGMRVAPKPLIKKSLTLIPFLGQMFLLSCIPIDRSSKEARRKSKEIMLANLQKGISILIFAKGTRNTTGQPLKDFFDGAFDLSVSANIPILPIVFTNIKKVNPNHDWFFRPSTIEVRHLKPIFPKENSEQEAKRIKQETFNEMWNCLVEHNDEFKNFEKK